MLIFDFDRDQNKYKEAANFKQRHSDSLSLSRHTGRKAGIKRLLLAEIVLHVHAARSWWFVYKRRRVKDIDKKKEREKKPFEIGKDRKEGEGKRTHTPTTVSLYKMGPGMVR